MDSLIKESIQYLSTNSDLKYALQGWINNGDLINLRLVTGQNLPFKYQEIIDGLEFVLGDADIRTTRNIVLWRETSFHNRTIPTMMSVSSRSMDSFCGCFGDKVYPIFVPKGTRVFYISALDHISDFPDEETEQEFLLEKGVTNLVNGELIFESKEM